jgi:hypothetical protein
MSKRTPFTNGPASPSNNYLERFNPDFYNRNSKEYNDKLAYSAEYQMAKQAGVGVYGKKMTNNPLALQEISKELMGRYPVNQQTANMAAHNVLINRTRKRARGGKNKRGTGTRLRRVKKQVKNSRTIKMKSKNK